MDITRIDVEEVRKRLQKCKDTGARGLDGWSPKDMKALPDLVGKTGIWPYAMTHLGGNPL